MISKTRAGVQPATLAPRPEQSIALMPVDRPAPARPALWAEYAVQLPDGTLWTASGAPLDLDTDIEDWSEPEPALFGTYADADAERGAIERWVSRKFGAVSYRPHVIMRTVTSGARGTVYGPWTDSVAEAVS
ncbi:hypothetical protein [Nocardia sp. NPDC051750]|uniref:hypothetical protein n=1 Tax=Nocardia sp. NPDC051750 TaxID=3364325 RepID=UPI00379E57E9